MSRNLKYIPQPGSSITDAVREAIKIAKALDDANLYAFLVIHYNDVSIGINEKSNIQETLKNLRETIENKYKCQNHGEMICPGGDWLTNKNK